MTTVKTEIWKNVDHGFEFVFETMYAGNQNFVYKFDGKDYPAELWFKLKNEIFPTLPNVIKVK